MFRSSIARREREANAATSSRSHAASGSVAASEDAQRPVEAARAARSGASSAANGTTPTYELELGDVVEQPLATGRAGSARWPVTL